LVILQEREIGRGPHNYDYPRLCGTLPPAGTLSNLVHQGIKVSNSAEATLEGVAADGTALA
jgi:hypothetical protein